MKDAEMTIVSEASSAYERVDETILVRVVAYSSIKGEDGKPTLLMDETADADELMTELLDGMSEAISEDRLFGFLQQRMFENSLNDDDTHCDYSALMAAITGKGP